MSEYYEQRSFDRPKLLQGRASLMMRFSSWWKDPMTRIRGRTSCRMASTCTLPELSHHSPEKEETTLQI